MIERTSREFHGDGTLTLKLTQTYDVSLETENGNLASVVNEKTISVTLAIKDYVIDKLPETCFACPCGFSTSGGCGRQVPLDSHKRSEKCKLIDIKTFLKNNNIPI